VKKGLITDVRAAAEAISVSVERAEAQSGFKIMSALVGIAGAHVCSTQSHSTVAVRSADGVISRADVERALDAARITELPADQEILHALPRHFAVDGMNGIDRPLGMRGHRLEADVCLITGSVTPIHNVLRSVEAAGLELEELVLEPLAAGLAALSDEERRAGTLLVDIGGGTTDAAVFRSGELFHTFILPVGGFQISNDLALGLELSYSDAEEVKIKHGSTLSLLDPEARTRSSMSFQPPEPVNRRVVAEIIEARLEETFELLLEEIERAGLDGAFPGGVVLTGGSARIPGASALASSIFQEEARLGAPRACSDVPVICGPEYSASVGLLHWGAQHLQSPGAQIDESRIGRTGTAIKAWLRNLLG